MNKLFIAVLMVLALGGSAVAAPVPTNVKDGYGNVVMSDYEVGQTYAFGGSGTGTGGK